MNEQELRERVQELRELRRLAAELGDEINSVTDQLKAHMTANGVEALTGADFKLTWKPVTVHRFDKSRMIAAFGQSCYDEFCKTTTARRFILA